MKRLLIAFILCLLVLGLQFSLQSEPDVFADGRLLCLPLPPEFAPRPAIAPAPPRPGVQPLLGSQPTSVMNPSSPIVIAEPEPGNEQLAEIRRADRSDWGIPQGPAQEPITLATAPQPRLIQSAIVPEPEETPTSTAVAEVVPNLYLPEGAVDEAGAQLTLIRSELQIFDAPDRLAPTTPPLVMKQGDKIRPLARIRNDSDFDWLRIERDGKTYWAQAEYFIRVDPRNQTDSVTRNLTIGEEAVDKDSALPPDYQPDDMVAVPRNLVLDGREILLREEACQALQTMIRDAAKEGMKLRVFSGFRDFEYQRKLYLESVERQGPKQNGTAAPGYSEHQLGTTVDISNTDKRYVLSQDFANTREGHWLDANLAKYGFRFSYTQENSNESGYHAEPWHLRYVGKGEAVTETQLASGH